MKFIILVSFVMASQLTFAGPSKLSPCNSKDLKDLEESIKEWSQKDLPSVSYLKNSKSEIVGFFATNNNDDMYAELCDYVEGSEVSDDLTVASRWYYWESESKANPRLWNKGSVHELVQDEGKAEIKVLTSSSKGLVVVEFKVKGWDSRGNKTLRKDTLTFFPRK